MALINRLPCNLINIQSIRNKTNKIRSNVSDNSKINELKTVLFSRNYNKNEMNEI